MNSTNQMLPRKVMRMCLAGKYQQYRTFRIIQHFYQAVRIVKQQCGPFVGWKPARKSDDENIGLEWGEILGQSFDLGLTASIAPVLVHGALPDLGQQVCL